MSDEELARLARAGSTESFSELVRRFDTAVYTFLLVRTRCTHDARELSQETFLRAWKKLGHYDPSRRFSTWLFTLARHAAVGHFRRAPRAIVAADTPAPSTREADPQREASRREELGRLWSLAARVLKEEQRSALWLRYGEDLAIPEIARILGRPASTVRVQLFRARELLARALVEQSGPSRARMETPSTRGRVPAASLRGDA